MPYRGHIENGVVVLDEALEIADATVGAIETLKPPLGGHHKDDRS